MKNISELNPAPSDEAHVIKKSPNSLIQLQNVSRRYDSAGRRFDALRNIKLSIQNNEYVAITGKSGSGKSTLLNMITGIDRPSSGSVIINNQEIHKLNEGRLANFRGRNIGIVFQFFQLIPTLSILENILLAMDFVDAIAKKDRVSRAETLLNEVGIYAHKDKTPSALSGGEQQRAAIARAISNDPLILVADEPTGNLDSKTGEAIQTLFEGLVNNGKTVVVVTHEEVQNFSYDRIIAMADGEIISDKGGK